MNAAGFPLLSLLTFLPLVGGAIILSVRGDDAVVATNARYTALWTSLIVFALSIDDFVVTQYMSSNAATTTIPMIGPVS